MMILLRRNRPFDELEKRIGYRFHDSALIAEAVTHPSYRAENAAVKTDNQRLEFLGDAVLGLLTAGHVFATHADDDEGVLTAMRSQAASGAALAELAREIDLGRYLRLGKGESQSGGRDRDSMLADAMEALLGAVYLDGSLRAVQRVFARLCVPRLGELSRTRDVWANNPKGKLQDLAQRHHGVMPIYAVVNESGPLHERVFVVEVRVGETLRAVGEGRSKRLAQIAAAEAMLERMPE